MPDCSTVILFRPTQSLTLYIQQCMRGMRYQPGKKATIIDHVGNVQLHGLPDEDRVWSLDKNPSPKMLRSVRVVKFTLQILIGVRLVDMFSRS